VVAAEGNWGVLLLNDEVSKLPVCIRLFETDLKLGFTRSLREVKKEWKGIVWIAAIVFATPVYRVPDKIATEVKPLLVLD